MKGEIEGAPRGKNALVHGDVSPKNILKGRKLPIFLDAETAWFGDPAFDPAFCLNHFLLKAAHLPEKSEAFLDCFKSFAESYLNEAIWEARAGIEARTARLLPMLHLARIDGKSPVEYLADENAKNKIRRIARSLINEKTDNLSEFARKWKKLFISKV